MAAEMFFVDPTAALMPQSELAAMSKGQLVQCVTVLQAGWIAAKKKVSETVRSRELDDRDMREEIASQRGTVMSLQSQLRASDDAAKALRRRNHELEGEVAAFRRGQQERPDDPVLGATLDELAQSKGRVIELERLVRQRDPLNIQFLKIRIDELTKQRERDKLKIQEMTLLAERQRQRLEDAQEANSFNDRTAMDHSPPQRENRFRGDTSVIVGPESARAERSERANLKTSFFNLSLPRPVMVEVEVQTETGTLRLLDLLNERSKQLDDARAACTAAEDERDSAWTEMASLRTELTLLRESEARKESLLDELSSPSRLRRLASFKSREDLEKEESDRVAMADRARKMEAAAHAADARAVQAEARCRSLEVEVGRLSQSFSTVAEENVHLSHSLQALGTMTAKDIASMLTAGEKAGRLRAEVADLQAKLDRERINATEMEKSARENGTLRAKAEKFQLEIATLATESTKLSKELQQAYAQLEKNDSATRLLRAANRSLQSTHRAYEAWLGVGVVALDAAFVKANLLLDSSRSK